MSIDIEKRKAGEIDFAIIDIEQFIHEVQHAQSVGASWYTKGESGLYGQV